MEYFFLLCHVYVRICALTVSVLTHALVAVLEPEGEEGCSGSRFTRQVGNEQPSPKLKKKKEKKRTNRTKIITNLKSSKFF